MSVLRDLVAAATPGPWEPWVEGDVFINGDLAWGGDNIVTSSTSGGWTEITHSRENIRLMALAPELAVLLDDVFYWLQGTQERHGAGAQELAARLAALERRAAQPADGAS